MAKKSTRRNNAEEGRTQNKMNDYKEVIQNLSNNPAVRYVAGGIATAVLARVASSLSKRYPEITNVLRENLDFLEEKLVEFKNASSTSSQNESANMQQ